MYSPSGTSSAITRSCWRQCTVIGTCRDIARALVREG
jgi:hypothetical protein